MVGKAEAACWCDTAAISISTRRGIFFPFSSLLSSLCNFSATSFYREKTIAFFSLGVFWRWRSHRTNSTAKRKKKKKKQPQYHPKRRGITDRPLIFRKQASTDKEKNTSFLVIIFCLIHALIILFFCFSWNSSCTFQNEGNGVIKRQYTKRYTYTHP